MGLRIRTNIASLTAQRRLGNSTEALQASGNKLASGERINKAADDAAGLAISENLRADVRSLNMAKRNTLDGVSLVQTAEGGLMETTNMLVRLRELAVQAASDTIGTKERGFLDQEYQSLKSEIDRIASSTEFNGTRLLVGTTQIADDMHKGENQFPLEVQVGKDYYRETDSLENKATVNIIRLDLNNINGFSTGENSLMLDKTMAGEDVAGIAEKHDAQLSIGRLDEAITTVNSYRAYLGAVQNRMTSTIANLGVQTENLDTARSRIRDTDFAAETAEYTKSKILQQAGTSILAQANQQPQVALGLLQNL
ncbi:MAG: flagellin [Proteobacteria bacterium]|jgi:flagellin|nr:flagellin [Pseudomonadota bacterium]